jgi:hypothetical protein
MPSFWSHAVPAGAVRRSWHRIQRSLPVPTRGGADPLSTCSPNLYVALRQRISIPTRVAYSADWIGRRRNPSSSDLTRILQPPLCSVVGAINLLTSGCIPTSILSRALLLMLMYPMDATTCFRLLGLLVPTLSALVCIAPSALLLSPTLA